MPPFQYAPVPPNAPPGLLPRIFINPFIAWYRDIFIPSVFSCLDICEDNPYTHYATEVYISCTFFLYMQSWVPVLH